MRMNILFASDVMSSGGASKLIFDLIHCFVEQGNHCELLILADQNLRRADELMSLGVRITIVPKERKTILEKLRFIESFIDDGHFDVIHAHLFPMFYYIALAKRRLGDRCPPIIMTEHNTENRRRNHPMLRPIEKYIYQKYSVVVSISDKAQTNLIQWLECKEYNKFMVLYNGIPLDQFMLAVPCDRSQLIPGYAESDFILCMVGRFVPQKNHMLMIEVLSKLPDYFKLIMLGEGELLQTVQEEVRRRNLSGRAFFLGFRADVARVMKTADVIVLPSEWEGLCLTAVEAMACARPIVCSDVPGLSEVVGDTGIKVEVNQTDSFVRALRSLEDSELAARYSKHAVERAKRFDIGQTAKGYFRIYQQLTAGKAGGS